MPVSCVEIGKHLTRYANRVFVAPDLTRDLREDVAVNDFSDNNQIPRTIFVNGWALSNAASQMARCNFFQFHLINPVSTCANGGSNLGLSDCS